MRVVQFKDEKDKTIELIVDGKNALLTEIGFFVPVGHMKNHDLKISHLPQNIVIHFCFTIFCGQPMCDNSNLLHYFIERVSDRRIKISFQLCIRKESWDEDYDISVYGKKAKDVVLDRERIIGDITLEEYEDDENFILLNFFSFFENNDIDNMFEYIDDVILDFKAGLYTALRKPIRSLLTVKDEEEFTKDIVIHLLRRQGYIFVRYNHGNREFGKDILFLSNNKNGESELCAAQVKYDGIKGGAKGDVNTIINQIRIAFSTPVIDLPNFNQQRISKLIIITAGCITNNAKDEIYNAVDFYLPDIKNKLSFLDRSAIEDLMYRYYS